MVGVLVFLVAALMIGCSEFARESTRHEPALQANGAEETSKGNLPAIKALLDREREQFHAVSTPIHKTDGRPSLQSSPADDVASSSASPTSTSENLTSDRLRMLLVTPHLTTKAFQQAPQVLRLVPPTRSSADTSPQDRPAVPPYTFFAPVGSAYPGTIRCVPDYLGGQRCRSSP